MRLRQLMLASVILSIAMLAGCTRIGPGHAGIVVNQAGNDRGVSQQTATTGWVWYNPFTENVIEYQTSMRCVKWTRDPNEGKQNINEEISFTNQDQMVISADIGVCFSMDSSKLPGFYVKFLAKDEDDLDSKFTSGYLKNVVRNCMNDYAGKYTIAQLMGDNAGFLADAKKCISDDVVKYGITMDQYGLLGAPRPPQQVIDSINSKSQAEQVIRQKQLEVAQAEADAKSAVAKADGEGAAILAVAQAQAKANELLSRSITEQLVRYKAIEKWDGVRPQVEGSGSGLLMQITPRGKTE